MTDQIIDPPVTPYSSPEAIQSWLEDLRRRPDSEAVREAIAEAERWLDERTEDGN